MPHKFEIKGQKFSLHNLTKYITAGAINIFYEKM